MTIHKSSEFKGFAFNFDQAEAPFFKALCKENLRLLAGLRIGKRLLRAIQDAKPSYRLRNYPSGVNVVLQPPLARGWSTPGLSARTGNITDQAKFDAFNEARNPVENIIFEPGPDRIRRGKLVPGISAKTSLQEDNRTAAKNGTGSTATLFYSNTEILSDSGTWFIPHVTMGHELIHCLHSLRGEMKDDDKDEEYFTVGIKGFDYEFTENKIRQEAGFPMRTKYFADD